MSKSPPNPWYVLTVVTVGTFMAALDGSIVNISVPALINHFQASVFDVEWVITAYMISFAVFIPITHWLRQKMGSKNLYILSLGVFTLGSLLCGLANSLQFLIWARVVQAMGAGALTPTAMSLVSDAFPPAKRGTALGYWGIGAIMGPTLGPTLGGVLTEYVGWRSIFLVNIPIGFATIYASIKILKAASVEIKKAAVSPFDFVGFLLLAPALILFLYALSQGEVQGWWTSSIMGMLFSSVALAVLFIYWELRALNPLLDFRILKRITFTVCLGITACRSAALFGGIFLLPLFMQQKMHMSETMCGLAMLPGSIVMAALMPFSGRWHDIRGARLITLVGLSLVAVSMCCLYTIEENSSMEFLIVVTLIRGVGLGLLVTPITTTAINAVMKTQVVMASSLQSLVQQVAGSVGIASMAAIYQYRSHHYTETFLKIFPGQPVITKSEVLATQDAFLAGAFLTILSAGLALWLPSGAVGSKNAKHDLVLE